MKSMISRTPGLAFHRSLQGVFLIPAAFPGDRGALRGGNFKRGEHVGRALGEINRRRAAVSWLAARLEKRNRPRNDETAGQ